MHKTIRCTVLYLFSAILFAVACTAPSPEWENFKKCTSNACVKEAIAVKDAFLKDPKGMLNHFQSTYTKGEDHVIGWLYIFRDSVLANARYGSVEERMLLQKQIVDAAQPFSHDPKLSEMAQSVLSEIGNFAIRIEVEDAATVTGTYSFELPKNGGSGLLKVLSISPEKVRYALTVVGRAPAYNQGMLEGEASMINPNEAVLETTQFNGICRIVCRFAGDTVYVKTLEGESFTCGFGHGVMADGTYLREDDLDPFRAEGGEEVPEQIMGRWQSLDDPKSVINISADRYENWYDGKKIDSELYSYHQKCPADCGGDTGMACLRVVGQDVLCYGIVHTDAKTLHLHYIGGAGKTLRFKKG